MINIEVNATEVVNTIDNLAVKQIPYALARAVRLTGLDFQAAERARLRTIFTLRREKFIDEQGVKVLAFPTKARPSMTIGQDDKAEFLGKFETGVPKTSLTGPNVAVPVDVRPDVSEIVPEKERPHELFADAKKNQVFLIRPGDSARLAPGIYQRDGRSLTLLYSLTPSAKIQPELGFEATARKTVADRWATNFSETFELGMRDAPVNGEPADITPLGTTQGE